MKKEIRQYVAKKGSRITNEQAQLYGEYIDKNGYQTPEEIVEDARDLKSILHSFFNWDNKQAAESWRKQQARMLLNSIQVTINYVDNKGKTVSSETIDRYENIKINILESKDNEDIKNIYLTNEKIIKTPEYVEQILQECITKIISFKNKYNYYAKHKEFKIVKPLFKVISEIENKIEKRKEKNIVN